MGKGSQKLWPWKDFKGSPREALTSLWGWTAKWLQRGALRIVFLPASRLPCRQTRKGALSASKSQWQPSTPIFNYMCGLSSVHCVSLEMHAVLSPSLHPFFPFTNYFPHTIYFISAAIECLLLSLGSVITDTRTGVLFVCFLSLDATITDNMPAHVQNFSDT